MAEAAHESAARGLLRTALVVLGALTTVTATGGGFALVASLEGSRFPAELLRGTPFSSYVAPGLILALLVGGSAAVATAAALCTERLGPRLSALAGGILMGWIVGEVVILRAPEARSSIEAIFFGIGLLMAVLGVACCQTERRAQGRLAR